MDLSKFVRRDISGIRKDILPLSGFGILSHALADEIAARNQVHEGFYRSTEMEFLEDSQPEPPPMMPPAPIRPETVKMDMTLLFKIVQQSRDPAQDTALPAGTRKMLERVRTILTTGAQNRPQPVSRVVRPVREPGNLRQVSAPSAFRPGTDAGQRGFAYRQMASRMQNPLRDPKAPVAVEKMRTPSRETARASDHAMLFSDVLRRAQDAGLTFASRQGGVPASAQTRKAYTDDARRQAEAERRAEEEQIPVWQKKPPEAPSQKPLTAAGISPQPGILRDDPAGVKNSPLFAVGYPEAELNFAEETASPESAELSGLAAPKKSPANPQTAEIARAMQEAGAKALTEGVAEVLRETSIPPKATSTVENLPGESAHPERSLNAAPGTDTAVFAVAPEPQKRPVNAGLPEKQSGQTLREISRSENHSDIAAQKAAETVQPAVANAEDPVPVPVSAESTRESVADTPEMSRNLPEEITKPEEQTVTAKETSAPLSGDRDFAERAIETQMRNNPLFGVGYPEAELNFAEEIASPENEKLPGMRTSPKSLANSQTAEIARAMQEAGAKALTEGVAEVLRETSIPPKAAPMVENVPGVSGGISHDGNVVPGSTTAAPMPVQETVTTPGTPETSRNAEAVSAESTRESVTDTPEMSRNLPEEIAKPEELSATAKETPVTLSGDRDFAERAIETQMQNNPLFGVGHPEAELNFAEEVSSPESAGLPGLAAPKKSPADPQTAEIARAMQEAGAKALTEGVADVLRETSIPPKATSTVENLPGESAHPERSLNAAPGTGTAVFAVAPEPQKRPVNAGLPEKQSGQTLREISRNLPEEITKPEEQTVTAKETSASLSGDRDFAERAIETQMRNNPLFGVGYPEAELNFAEETASPESAGLPEMRTSPKSLADPQTAEIARVMQEAGAKALTEGVADILREAASRTEPGTQNRTVSTSERRNKAETPMTQKAAAERSGTAECSGNTPGKASAETMPLRAGENGESRNRNAETPDPRKNAGSRREELHPADPGRTAEFGETDAEERIPPLGGGTIFPGSVGGQERIEDRFRQQGYGTPTLEYRDEEAPAGMPGMSEIPAGSERESFRSIQTAQEAQIRRAAGEAAQDSILWLGRKVAGRAAEEMARMQRTLPQPGGILRPESRMLPQTQPLHTMARASMGDPASARWTPGGPTAAVRAVSPAEMPHLMYQTGKETGDGLPFGGGPGTGTSRPQMQVGNPVEVQRAYPALSMEYSSPMSRMEEQIQTAMAQQMSAASRPIGMQTGASQYMAGKASPDSMKTLDQMSPPPVQDQVVWQNPYLRSAPADMTYRSKKKEAPEQPQPAPRPAARMSDAEIHRMADQVFRIVKDKIRQERRKMGL